MLRSPIYFLAVFILPLLSLSCTRDNAKNGFHPYDIQHGALHFEFFGDTRGTDDLFFDRFGDREAHVTHSEIITDKEFRPSVKYVVLTKGNVIVVDSARFETVRLKDKISDSLYRLSPGDVPTAEEQFAIAFGKQGFVQRADTLIRTQGVVIKAHVWQLAEMPSFVFEFKGLIVGNYSNVNGHINELRLVSIDTVNAIDTMRFIPPNGFPIKDMTKQGSNLPNNQP